MDQAADSVRMRAPRWHVGRGKAAVFALLCWAGVAVVAGLVASGRAAPLDALGLLFWRAQPELVPAGPPLLVEMVRDLTSLGGVLLRNLLAIAAVVALLFLRLRREAALLAFTVAGGWLANTLLKLAMGRARPEIVPHLTTADGASFPSGHSFNSAVVFVAIALAFAALSTRRPVRRTIVGAALAFSMAVAWTRVWLGVHFPSDVIAGWLGGVGWAFLAAAVLQAPARATARLIDDQAAARGGT